MISILRFIKGIIQLFLNILFVIQITIVILVFLTATHWFFNLIGSNLLNFVEPISSSISDFVKNFYNKDVLLGGAYVDGTILLFDIVAVIFVFIISKSKYYIYRVFDFIDLIISTIREGQEKQFNAELKRETEAQIKQANSAALLIEFEIKDLLAEGLYRSTDISNRDIKEKEEYSFKILYTALKNLESCRFARSGQNLTIFVDDFYKIDNVILFLEEAIKRLKINLKKDKYELNSYISADVFEKNTNFKENILPKLNQLLKLRNKDVITCFGNFNLRYMLNPEPMYYATLLKGEYVINGGTDIYILIKKN